MNMNKICIKQKNSASPFSKNCHINENHLGSCIVYYMKPGGIEKKHFHDGIEIVYIIKGSCKTHKEGKVYVYQPREAHEVINDSNKELVFVCLTIPPESEKNTYYL